MENRAKILGENIKMFRKSKGWSQEELAHLANMTPSHLGHIERGDSNPTFYTLLSISDALQIKFEELTGSDAKTSVSQNGLKLEKLQGEFDSLSPERQREIYGIIKTMLNWNSKQN